MTGDDAQNDNTGDSGVDLGVKEGAQNSIEQSESKIIRTNEAAARMEAANKKAEDLLLRQEAAQVERILGGSSTAGVQQKTLSDDEQKDADARAFLGDTGYADDLFPEKKP